jgi:hypothetical protein
MHEIILSYTRSDDPVCVARLADSLERLFGEGTVYGDVDSERAGGDWKKAIARKVSGAEVVLAVMGPTWQDLIATGPSEESERARFELNQAHDLDVPVIPVLLAQTRFDYERNLGDLAWLKDLQFFELADGQGRWNSDLARLAGEIARITSLEKRASEQEKARSTSRASHGDQSPNIGTARGGVKISYGRKSVPPPPRQPSPTPREAPAARMALQSGAPAPSNKERCTTSRSKSPPLTLIVFSSTRRFRTTCCRATKSGTSLPCSWSRRTCSTARSARPSNCRGLGRAKWRSST